MIRAYQYGCLEPIAGREVLEDQLRRANRLWNVLVEIERRHRDRYRELLAVDSAAAAADDAVKAAMTEIAAMRESIKAKRKRARKNVEIDDGTKARLAAARAQLAELVATAKQARAEARARLKDQLHDLETERRAAVKAARQAAAADGLYWGTYNAVIASYETGRQRALRSGAELRFRRYTGEGGITVQIGGGLPTDQVFGSHGQLQIDPLPEGAFTHPSRGERGRRQRTCVRIRATSTGRDPVWVELPMVMHRPLPPGMIKEARLTRVRVATHWRYRLSIIVDEPDVMRHPACTDAVALDLCWRQVSSGIRVGFLADDAGRLSVLAGLPGVAVGDAGSTAQIVLPDSLLSALRRCDELRSIRDGNFNAARDELAAWLNTATIPDWLRERTTTLPQWRSAARLAALVLAWREGRFPGDDEIYARLEAWRKQDKHLYEWQENLREKLLLRRREMYRVIAARLAQTYGRIVLEDIDLRQFAIQSEPEEGPRDENEARRQRMLAAPSQLRAEIERAAMAAGVEVVRSPAEWTTQRCHACGELERFDAAKWLHHTCSRCGASWDQDENACRNLLLENCEGPAGKMA
jgi:hypothetical protein